MLLSRFNLVFLVLFCFYNSVALGQDQKKGKESTFRNEWYRISYYEANGLTKSALLLTDSIYQQAKLKRIYPEAIKALMHHINFTQQLELDALPGLVKYTEQELNEFGRPERNILESILAQLYQRYYQENQWLINERTFIDGSDDTDIKEWNFQQFFTTIIKHYQASLTNPELLTATDISDYELILEKGNTVDERPTLYDFLVNQALEYYSGYGYLKNTTGGEFILNEKEAFAPSSIFSNYEFESLKYNNSLSEALRLYQNWIRLRLGNVEQQKALFFADLQRLDFVKRHSTRSDKDSLYMIALNNWSDSLTNSELQAEICFLKAEYYFNNQSFFQHNQPETEKYRNYLTLAHKWCEKSLSQTQNDDFKSKCKQMIQDIEKPQLNFETESVVISDLTFPVSLTFANVSKIYVRVYRVSHEALEKNQRQYNQKEFYNSLINKSTVYLSYEKELPRVTNYREYNTEMLAKALPKGFYLLAISNKNSFNTDTTLVSYNIIQASSLAYIQKTNGSGDQQFFLANRKSGFPIAGAKVNVFKENYNYRKGGLTRELVEQLSTNKQGMVIVKETSKIDDHSFVLQFIYKNDTLPTNSYYIHKPYSEEQEMQIHWFTDRAIYRPGQVVYFKGLVIERNEKSQPEKVENHSVELTFRDANWQEISKQTLTTNSYGTFSGSLVIPKSLLNGNISIHTMDGIKRIQVEEYKRPTFEVIVDTLKDQFKLDERVNISGNVRAFNGMNVTSAKVKWRVVRAPNYWQWWKPQMQEQQIAFGELATDENGNIRFSFKAQSGESTPSKWQSFNFKIEITVTDNTGETQTATEQLIIGGAALNLSLLVNEQVDISKPSAWKLEATNNAGQEAKALVHVQISKLMIPDLALLERKWRRPDTLMHSESEYRNTFPGFNYNNSDYYKNPTIKNSEVWVEEIQLNGTQDYLPKGIENWGPGMYRIQIKAKDGFGDWITQTKYATVYDSNQKKVPFDQINWHITSTQTKQPGELGKLVLGTSEKIWVLYDLEFDDKVILSEQFLIKDGVKELHYPVTEELRGGFALHSCFIYHGRVFEYTQLVTVPFTNKELKVSWQTFRDKIHPGDLEEWTLKIEGPKGEKVAAELVASMYDASLDQLMANPWKLNLYPGYYYNKLWGDRNFDNNQSRYIYLGERDYFMPQEKTYDRLNWFDSYNYSGMGISSGNRKNFTMKAEQIPMSAQYMVLNDESDLKIKDSAMEMEENVVSNKSKMNLKDKKEETNKAELRTNFNETAFFYPHLLADSTGMVTIKFKLPQSLTRWKFQALAHTKNLEYGMIESQTVAQKELMVQIQAPRFVTQGDRLMLPCKIENLTDSVQKGKVTLSLSNPLTDANYNSLISGERILEFECNPKATQTLFYSVNIPDTITSLLYAVAAESDRFTDGEQKWIQILSEKVLVTESKPLWINGSSKKSFELEGLTKSESNKSIQHHKLTLEFTANPSWYAVMALPFLLEQESSCSEVVFNTLYANQLAYHIVAHNPSITKLFEEWKRIGTERPFLSVLEQNQELKQTLLRETPWVIDAMRETEQKQRIALLFDANQMENRMRESIGKLKAMQYNSGAWPWYSGMMESRYVTQYLVTGFGKLKSIGALGSHESEVLEMATNAIRFLDGKMVEDYKKIIADKQKPFISPHLAQYLYMRSFYTNLGMDSTIKKAYDYFVQTGKNQWTKTDKFTQGMLALAFNRSNEKETALKIIASLKEHSLQNEEMGMFWKENVPGYNWYQAPIEFQSLMVEVFHEIAPNTTLENDLKKWLLKNKQTHAWETTKATADAVYSFLNSGDNWISKTPEIELTLGKQVISGSEFKNLSEIGSGYFKKSWTGAEVKSDMGKISIQRKGSGISWGGLYWQYFQPIDQIKSGTSGLSVVKKIYLEKLTPQGIQLELISYDKGVNVGDKIRVQLMLQSDRAMEFVQLKDQRAAAFEPVSVISGYQYSQGLGYYQVTHDASTEFFIDYLSQGKFLVEYTLFVTHSGEFSSGPAVIQSMYAPEFSAHSQGSKVEVKP